jgi:hypothetical protein
MIDEIVAVLAVRNLNVTIAAASSRRGPRFEVDHMVQTTEVGTHLKLRPSPQLNKTDACAVL